MSSVYLKIDNISLTFPVYGADAKSIKKRLFFLGSGGKLSRGTRDRLEVQALKGVSFQLHEGDRLGIVGPNGSGKSTLLRVITGIYCPQVGKVKTSGKIVSVIEPNVALDPFATGIENIKTRAILFKVQKREVANFIQRVADLSALGDYLAIPVHSYSSGMVMRLNFALSVSVDPDILVLDEWLSVTDLSFQERAEEKMQRIIQDARILVLASHNLSLLKRVCNTGLFLNQGKIKAIGAIANVVSEYQAHSKSIDHGTR